MRRGITARQRHLLRYGMTDLDSISHAKRGKPAQALKILHTSDWHLGRTLYGRTRYVEFEAFLNWLEEQIKSHDVDVLLIAGDIFDTTTPSNRAQQLYYRFLCTIAASPCRHVVIIGGNHDSASFLNAPRDILHALNVHVVGAATDEPGDEVIVLRDDSQQVELIVCAVPYLRDKDIRTVKAGESIDDKARQLVAGIAKHYADVCTLAEQQRTDLGVDVPIVAMGHMFAAGGHTTEGDGVRELYVGSLAHVHVDIFPSSIDYLALGHLHVPQILAGREHMRYCGSPLAMGFGEARQDKIVCLVSLEGRSVCVEKQAIPRFQKLEQIKGTLDQILTRLGDLSKEQGDDWLEITYEGDALPGDLRNSLNKAVSGSNLQLLRIKNNRLIERALNRGHEQETLDSLSVEQVFERCLSAHQVPKEKHRELLASYRECLVAINEEDADRRPNDASHLAGL